MAKHCLRFAKLFLGYCRNTEVTPANFSLWLHNRHKVKWDDSFMVGGPEMMEQLLLMVYKSRHQLKEKVKNPGFDPLTFFFAYQMNLPKEKAPLMAFLFKDLPEDINQEIVDALLNETAVVFQPRRSVWSDPGVFGDSKFELTPEPRPKPKPLPTPTHKAPSTLQ